jgi:hypothetical protein
MNAAQTIAETLDRHLTQPAEVVDFGAAAALSAFPVPRHKPWQGPQIGNVSDQGTEHESLNTGLRRSHFMPI